MNTATALDSAALAALEDILADADLTLEEL